MKNICFCVPTVYKPYQATLDALEASVVLLNTLDITHSMVSEVGCPYISYARANMLRKALNKKADIIIFIDHDISWEPEDLVKLIQTEGNVVAGTYRFKRDKEEYMGQLFSNSAGTPDVREDGAISSHSIPAGFLKITEEAVNILVQYYPELLYGKNYSPSIDLFNHGAFEGVWYGEDYAFSRRWLATGNKLWTIPDLNITHHSTEKAYPGNLHTFLRKQPGGDLECL